jgi:hypothetical protein
MLGRTQAFGEGDDGIGEAIRARLEQDQAEQDCRNGEHWMHAIVSSFSAG